MQSYELTPAPPVRAMAIGAVADLIGAVALVIGLDRGWVVLIVLGIVVLALGLGLLVAAVLLRARVRTTVALDSDGVLISSGGQQRRAAWSAITGLSTDGPTIYLDREPADGPPLKIGSPRGASDPQFTELGAELAARLDHDRGYRPLD